MRRRDVLAIVLVLGLLASVGFGLADGGAPPTHPTPGVTVWGPRVLAWRLVGAGADPGGLLCDHATPCRAPAERMGAGLCAVELRVWLSGNEQAPLLRGVEVFVSGVASRGGGEPRDNGTMNFSYAMTEYGVGVVDDWWWKGERHELPAAMPVPCDATRVQMSFNLHGSIVPIGEDQWAETATVELDPDAYRIL